MREDNKDLDASIAYTYDERGNILSKKYYDYTTGTLGTLNDEIVYAYDSTWKDKLVAYDNLEFEYDSIGNPTSYKGFDLTWQKGRQLKSIGVGDLTLLTYEYNAEGLRTKKSINGGDTTTYTWSSGLLMQQTDGTNTLNFSYSPDGRPLGVLFNGESYYYLYNLQGDVIGLYNYLGSVVVEYTYDSWGYLIDTTGSLADTLGKYNPFRYRGYIYDEETGFYWLRSRYYDPETGRFLNADGLIDNRGVANQNLFVYCCNNPINNIDTNGFISWILLLGIGLVAGIGGVLGFLSDTKLSSVNNKSNSNSNINSKNNANSTDINKTNTLELHSKENNNTQTNSATKTENDNIPITHITVGDRLANAFIGASLGLAVAGASIALLGVALSFPYGAFAVIPIFNMTSVQIFATGALAFDAFAMFIAPMFGITVEPIEYK